MSMQRSCDPAARSRLSGEYLSSSMAEVHRLKVTRGCMVSALSTLSRPSLPPTAMCVPSRLNCTERHWKPTEVARMSARLLASHSLTLLLSAAVEKIQGLSGCVAQAYRSAVCPLFRHRDVPPSPSSHTSHLFVPAMKKLDPGRLSSARNIGGPSPGMGDLSTHFSGLRRIFTAPRPSVPLECPVFFASVLRSAEPSSCRALLPCWLMPLLSWSWPSSFR
mmetsp:Transcript_20898/g.71207  ORF Transcript_20898/g.71207 Transcript_20898/m.71207 type:complete len:220 (+) Transcript_20898:1099-1758(+)